MFSRSFASLWMTEWGGLWMTEGGRYYLIPGDGGFTILEIDELVGAVVIIRTEGEADEALGFFVVWNAL